MIGNERLPHCPKLANAILHMPLEFSVTRILPIAALLIATTSFLNGQAGDAKDSPGTIQQEIWRDANNPPTTVLSPEEALDSFHLPDGFSLELVASEPLIRDPVSIAWDTEGRLWVAEMQAYMRDVDGTGEDQPFSRVVVLEDEDSDGRMDKSTVFLDNLVLPRTISFVEGGVLIADPPNLFFCKDTNGDLKSDTKESVAQYAAVGNVEHAENGLIRGIDNWLYSAKSERRLRFADGKITEEPTLFRGQWGIAMDDWGRLYYNTNSDYLFGDSVRWEDANRHPGWKSEMGLPTNVIPDRSIFTIRVNTSINRSYRENRLRPDFRLKNVDAICAPTINRGKRYPPGFYGNAFVPEPGGNAVARFVLRDEGMNAVGEKQLHSHPKWGQVEFIASTDERFRPVYTDIGPDGFLYIVDMHRGVIQHKTYLTTYLRNQSIERGLDKPIGLGRIYRLVHEDQADKPEPIAIAQSTNEQLIALLGSGNGWKRNTAQRLLVERKPQDDTTIDALRKLATAGRELERIHALWTLDGIGRSDANTLIEAMATGSDWATTHALRIAQGLANRDLETLSPAILNGLKEESERVRLQALYLSPHTGKSETVVDAILSLSEADLANPYFIDASVSVSHQFEEAIFEALGKSSESEGRKAIASNLGKALFNAKESDILVRSIGSLASDDWVAAAIATGVETAAAEPRAKPLRIPKAPAFARSGSASLSGAFSWPEKIGDQLAPLYEYSDAELASIAKGEPIYNNACAICHQKNGEGLTSLAPPLAASDWVTKSKTRLALIVSQGLEGPIVVNGKSFNSVMPPNGSHPLLQGDGMANLLSYVRYAWDNNAPPVSPEELAEILAPYADRTALWTVQELNEIE